MNLPRHPAILEVNVQTWLAELRRQQAAPVTLGTVPAPAWDAITPPGIDAVWLMGVWERSPAGAAVARAEQWLQAAGRSLLPGFTVDDIVASPYCVRRYVVDESFGGPDGLAAARRQLAARGAGLILDFVPNHVAMDHPWATRRPQRFIQPAGDDLQDRPDDFATVGGVPLAFGRDPFFPPWRDVLQLNTFRADVRGAAVATLRDLAGRCDGVRCDMAMLALTEVFAGTWGARAGPRPAGEYWSEVIAEVRGDHPGFTFIAEAYWGLEPQLLAQGFDYCYDKPLYDLLVGMDAAAVRRHLAASGYDRARLLGFVENHDEQRASARWPAAALRAAAVVVATLPGACLYHHGQFSGNRVRPPVQLCRVPAAAPDRELEDFYARLLRASRALRRGRWRTCDVEGWPDNDTGRDLLAWCWVDGAALGLVVVNLAPAAAQGRVRLPAAFTVADTLVLTGAFDGTAMVHDTAVLREHGLYVDLSGFGQHVWTGRTGPAAPAAAATRPRADRGG